MKKSKKNIHVGTIDMNQLQLNQRKFTTSEISRGTYIGKSKKGRASYNRKQKYKANYQNNNDNWLYIFLLKC